MYSFSFQSTSTLATFWTLELQSQRNTWEEPQIILDLLSGWTFEMAKDEKRFRRVKAEVLESSARAQPGDLPSPVVTKQFCRIDREGVEKCGASDPYSAHGGAPCELQPASQILKRSLQSIDHSLVVKPNHFITYFPYWNISVQSSF